MKVVHCKRDRFDIYIGRGSIYGNPYKIGLDGTRNEVIKKYKDWIVSDRYIPTIYKPSIEEIKLLKGKILGCWCTPKACHGDVLIELANTIKEQINDKT
jgi:hypothetical protein